MPAPTLESLSSLYSNPFLPMPLHADALDDFMPQAVALASKYSWLAKPFHSFLPDEWKDRLVGPDPGGSGRANRSQRSAAMGKQPGIHIAKNGLQLLIPETFRWKTM